MRADDVAGNIMPGERERRVSVYEEAKTSALAPVGNICQALPRGSPQQQQQRRRRG